MFLRSATLKNWGCHDDLAVAFEDGINICVGPNGAGKSTLYHAIVAALTVKHTSRHADLSRFQKWGRDGFGPTASLDLVREDGVWNLEKTFLHGPRCLLKQAPGAGTAKSFNGAKAEQELDRWLEGDGAAGRLILTLWSRQDAPIEYQEIPGAKSAALSTLLEKAIARATQPEAAGPFGVMKKKFADEYDARFTAEQKRIKKNSDLDKALVQRDEAQAHRDALRGKQADLAAKVAALRARTDCHDGDCRDRAEFRRRKAEREASRRDYATRAAALKLAEDRAVALRTEHDLLKRADDRLTLAEDQRAATEAKLRGLQSSLAEGLAQRDQAETGLAAARKRAEDGRPLLDELGAAFERQRIVTEAIENLKTRREAEAAARATAERVRSVVGQTETRSRDAREAAERAAGALAGVIRTRSRRDFLAAERAHHLAEAAHRQALAADLAAKRRVIRERLDKVRALERDLPEIGPDDDDAGPLPTAAERDALAAEAHRLAGLEGSIAGDALTARLVAEVPLQVELEGDGQPGQWVEVAAGEAIEGRGVARLAITISGVGRMVIGRTSADPADRLEQLRSGRDRLADRLRTWNAADLGELDARSRRAEARRNVGDRIAGLLGGLTISEQEAALADLDAELSELGVRDADSEPTPAPPAGPSLKVLEKRKNAAYLAAEAARAALGGADPDAATDDPARPESADPDEARAVDEAARRAVADATRQAQRAAIDQAKAETALTAAINQRAEADGRLAEETHGHQAESTIHGIRETILNRRADLEALGSPCGPGDTPASIQVNRDKLDQAVRSARTEFDRAKERWAEWDTENRLTAQAIDLQNTALDELRRTPGLDGDGRTRRERLRDQERRAVEAEAEARLLRGALPPDPEADGEGFEQAAQAAEERCHQGDIELEGLRVEIIALGADGLDTRVALAEEQWQRTEARVAWLQRDASAWALLHHLLAEVEAEQSRNVATRLQALAAHRVRHLTDGMVGEAIFDPKNLAPASARVPGVTASPSLDQFSRGTREQVALACRLQIGVLLSEERFRHVLLLDDPLAHTDTHRLQAALDMFESLRDRLQFIIFTCHEDRYRPLGEAATFHAIG